VGYFRSDGFDADQESLCLLSLIAS